MAGAMDNARIPALFHWYYCCCYYGVESSWVRNITNWTASTYMMIKLLPHNLHWQNSGISNAHHPTTITTLAKIFHLFVRKTTTIIITIIAFSLSFVHREGTQSHICTLSKHLFIFILANIIWLEQRTGQSEQSEWRGQNHSITNWEFSTKYFNFTLHHPLNL